MPACRRHDDEKVTATARSVTPAKAGVQGIDPAGCRLVAGMTMTRDAGAALEAGTRRGRDDKK
jgi:hypothetical protein